GTVEARWEAFAAPLVNDAAAAAELRALSERWYPEKRVVTDRAASMTGDDFSEFICTVPGAYAYLGTADPTRPETQHNIHSAEFDIDERALPYGAWLYAAAAIHWLSETAGKENGNHG
nr:amidohydrolase [Oscillospiraceae bacterium]